MPHAGLMDERALGTEKGPLLRARLHIRSGKRRLRQGKISAGVATLYDALLAGMDYYVEFARDQGRLEQKAGEDLRDEKVLYSVLVRTRVLDGRFNFDDFNDLVDIALNHELPDYDYRPLLTGIESVMVQLGVMPFDESTLPPEDPATF